MRQVVADLALETEAATQLAMRLAAAYDDDRRAASAFRRLATAVAKFWVTKRTAAMVAEAMECLGGNGYVEESILPRLYREAPLNAIWEGSGNVICLDVLRALSHEPECVPALLDELGAARGDDPRYDALLGDTVGLIRCDEGDAERLQARARLLTERLALLLQAQALMRVAPGAVAEAFLASRVAGEGGRAFGTLPDGIDPAPIIERAWPRPEA